MKGIKRWASTALNPTRTGFVFDVVVVGGFVLCLLYGFIL